VKFELRNLKMDDLKMSLIPAENDQIRSDFVKFPILFIEGLSLLEVEQYDAKFLAKKSTSKTPFCCNCHYAQHIFSEAGNRDFQCTLCGFYYCPYCSKAISGSLERHLNRSGCPKKITLLFFLREFLRLMKDPVLYLLSPLLVFLAVGFVYGEGLIELPEIRDLPTPFRWLVRLLGFILLPIATIFFFLLVIPWGIREYQLEYGFLLCPNFESKFAKDHELLSFLFFTLLFPLEMFILSVGTMKYASKGVQPCYRLLFNTTKVILGILFAPFIMMARIGYVFGFSFGK